MATRAGVPGPGRAPAGILAVVWLGLAGCGSEPAAPGDPATELPARAAPRATPLETSAPIVPASLFGATAASLDFSDEVADLRGRFRANWEPQARGRLDRALEEFAARAGANDRAGAAAALARARNTLIEGAAGAADLDAARRALDAMRAALDASSVTPDHSTPSGGTDDARTR